MTNNDIQQILDLAVTELQATTVGYHGHTPAWYANTTTHWFKGLRLIADAQAALEPAPPPPPPTSGVAPPVGPFAVTDGKMLSGASATAFVRTDKPTTLSKLNVKNFTDFGLGAMQYYPPSVENPGRTTLTDCVVENITRNPAGAADGTAEAAFWFGNPTTAKRFKSIQPGGWMGMWTGSKCKGTVTDPCVFEDFELVGPNGTAGHGIGLYVEHVTEHAVFRRFKIHHQQNGVNVEWWYGGQGSHDLLFENGDIYCHTPTHPSHAGMFLDAGTYGVTIRNCRFWGPGNAIGLPNKRVVPTRPNVVENCVFDNQGKQIFYHDNNIGS